MDRAYSVLEIKLADETDDAFFIKGTASTPTPDRMGDIVDPMGAKFKTPMPLLWQHRHDQPVGQVTFAKPTEDGIPFVATIPRIKEAGTLQDRVNEAIQSVKYKLVAAVSIGFRAINDAVERMDDGGLHFKEWEWLELSLVTVPANSEAVITAVKSIDQAELSAIGHEQGGSDTLPPGDSGPKRARRPILLIPRGNIP